MRFKRWSCCKNSQFASFQTMVMFRHHTLRYCVIACRLFSRGVIFTRARVSLALLSLRKNGGLLVVYPRIIKLIKQQK